MDVDHDIVAAEELAPAKLDLGEAAHGPCFQGKEPTLALGWGAGLNGQSFMHIWFKQDQQGETSTNGWSTTVDNCEQEHHSLMMPSYAGCLVPSVKNDMGKTATDNRGFWDSNDQDGENSQEHCHFLWKSVPFVWWEWR